LRVPDVDKLLGMEVYAAKTEGVGGAIKASADDFVVEEVLVDGSKASINGTIPSRVLGSTTQQQRYLLCVLIKRNWDTFIAVKNVAKSLGINQVRVQFAGIKDAKAVTAQYITLENVSAEDAGKVDVKNVKVIPLGYVREVMSLFYLLGNNFTITIKNPQVSGTAVSGRIEQTMRELGEIGGIPNFFGHQRFGTSRPITHLVGKALVQGRFEEAALLFLAKPSPHEHPESRQARQELQETHDFKRASELFPKQLRFEKLMLSRLSENPADFIGAFQKLPPKLQALFVQAHQSYLFNRFLSGRIKRGLPLNAAEVGDFVVGIERTGLPLTAAEKAVTAQNIAQINEAVKAGRMRVALPIFGVKQKLSQGVMGEVEQEVLIEEGVDAENLRFNVLSRTGGKGGLRTAAAPVAGFKLQSAGGGDAGVELSFMLLRGCYATVLLREIMKPSDPLAAGF
jgi:tRNA pseudouridine13 synthase